MNFFIKPVSFQWNTGNIDKNLIKHRVSNEECEEVFFDSSKKVYKDPLHSDVENRFILIGATKQKRLLFVVFTMRGGKVRVISARDLNKKEQRLYEKRT